MGKKDKKKKKKKGKNDDADADGEAPAVVDEVGGLTCPRPPSERPTSLNHP